jgi:ferrous iron transport protein B
LNGRSVRSLTLGICLRHSRDDGRTHDPVSRKERFLTLLIIPLMSCSARLPVFALLLGFLFWGNRHGSQGLP